MSAAPDRFEEWLDRIAAGERPTVEGFARSAIGELPRVDVLARALNPKAWGFKSQAQMNEAFDEQET